MPQRSEYICVVNGAQAETDEKNPPNSVTEVILTDVGGSFAKYVFTAPDEVKREMLAIALAAVSTQSQVLAVLDDPSSVTRQCLVLQSYFVASAGPSAVSLMALPDRARA